MPEELELWDRIKNGEEDYIESILVEVDKETGREDTLMFCINLNNFHAVVMSVRGKKRTKRTKRKKRSDGTARGPFPNNRSFRMCIVTID